MNRQDRRKAQIAKPAWQRMTPEQRAAAWSKNGITMQDLLDEYNKGYTDGRKDGIDQVGQTVYAAVCLALKEIHGFGKKRCEDLLRAVDEKVMYSLTSKEAIQQVWDEIGLKQNFTEPFDHIEKVEKWNNG